MSCNKGISLFLSFSFSARQRFAHSRRMSGISMIEVLVTLVLIAISMLGLMAVQVQTNELNNQAYLRSQAVSLAYDMAERVRLSATLAKQGHYNLLRNYNPPSVCPSGSITDQDRCEWTQRLAETLPDGDGVLALQNSDEITITVYWTEEKDQPGIAQFSLELKL